MRQSLPKSYRSVNYDLRPAKQVERRMIIDTLQRLASQGLPIRDYQYTGFGSIYFVDFILFHRILGMHRLLSAEGEKSDEDRVMFNRPFDCVKVVMEYARDVIPTLKTDRKHLLWLDYDQKLSQDQLLDIRLASSHLPCSSMLLITVDVEPPDKNGTPAEWQEYFREQGGLFYDSTLTVQDFAADNLPFINRHIVSRAITSGLTDQPGLQFLPLFNFLYADGHQMLTIGGIIGSSKELRMIRKSKLATIHYIRRSFKRKPYQIKVPCLTRKERLYLDLYMPCDEAWTPTEFGLESEELAAYREIYRFFPAYAELVL